MLPLWVKWLDSIEAQLVRLVILTKTCRRLVVTMMKWGAKRLPQQSAGLVSLEFDLGRKQHWFSSAKSDIASSPNTIMAAVESVRNHVVPFSCSTPPVIGYRTSQLQPK